MRVCGIHFNSFKRFGDRSFSFADEETGLAKELIVLLGPNGAGKSSILQAIAAALGVATGRLDNPAALDWPGFSMALSGRAWDRPPQVSLSVEFSKAELAATRDCYDVIHPKQTSGDASTSRPGQSRLVSLVLGETKVAAGSDEELTQFLGRSYASQAWRRHPRGFDLFADVGSVYWYTEQRNHSSLTAEDTGGKRIRPVTFELPMIRSRLQGLEYFHRNVVSGERPLRSGERDIFALLEDRYQMIFPERRFRGTTPSTGIGELLEPPMFFLWDGQREYELSEMSGGERAVFPILLDFVNLNINHSVILIDELELHLHPPMQQALLRALTSLGKGNQFIFTTHSDWVAEVAPPDSIVRVED